MPRLEVQDIHTFYGTSHILFGISLEVSDGETVCLLGRNGAGKTTTLKSIMGLASPRSGRITLDGKEISGLGPVDIARSGVGYVPEERIIFPDLTVRENLEVGTRGGSEGDCWTIESIYELFPMLVPLDGRLGAYLSGGEQQMLSIGRTLMGNPSLLLLDEPVEGLAPSVVKALCEQVQTLKKLGTTILFSEQNLAFSEVVADRVFIIESGHIRFEGDFTMLNTDPKLKHEHLAVG